MSLLNDGMTLEAAIILIGLGVFFWGLGSFFKGLAHLGQQEKNDHPKK